jgi:LacI family transcriptional regulator
VPKSRAAPRLVDVAEAAGVSLATASRSLSGQTGVSEAVAQRVRGVAQSLGYVANVHARTLAGGLTSMIGLIVHEIDDPYFSEIASGVVHAATSHQRLVQISHSGRDPEQELRQIRALIASRVDAIIIAGSGYTDPTAQQESRLLLARYADSGGRVAVIGRHELAVDAVLPANKEAGVAIAEHLISLGHRRIAIAAGTEGLTTVEDRLAGLADGFGRAHPPVTATAVRSDFTREGGRLAAEQIISDHPEVTAIIALNDAMAIGVLAALRSHRIAVPDQMSVVGFDDVSVAEALAPSLTTVRLPMATMGQLALEMTLKPPAAEPRRSATSHQLMVRDSTAAPRSLGEETPLLRDNERNVR